MTSERSDQSATSDKHGQPGATLASQREAMGWTVEQVAEQLKLAVRQVVAIEAGDYAALPSPAVTRGFVRAYAKILRLDPAPLVAMCPADNPPPADAGGAVRGNRPTSFSHSRYPTHGKRSSLPLAWIAGVVVVAAAGFAAWHFGLVKMPGSDTAATNDAVVTAPAETTTAPATQANDPVHNPTVPLISVPAPADANANANAGANAAPATTPVAPAATTAAPATTATATPAATPPAETPAAAPAAGASTLVLNVREDSWIEVKPKGGKALISRLVRAGSTETVEVPSTATLVVGNPTGVTATLGGAAVALPPVPGKTISRVTIK
jgi:cytoskeleton protein RodZ